MGTENSSKDLAAKVADCKSPEDVLALAKEEGIELSDGQLEEVSGGWGGDMIPIHEGRGVNLLTMESRNPTLDQRDVELLDALRKRGHASFIRLEHVRGEADVRLWVPDQILGAYGDEIVGRPKTQRWSYAWETVKESVERVDISLR